ncbi:MAG: hypothetical protein ABI472_24255, partial [Ginsengibacter sp.]
EKQKGISEKQKGISEKQKGRGPLLKSLTQFSEQTPLIISTFLHELSAWFQNIIISFAFDDH